MKLKITKSEVNLDIVREQGPWLTRGTNWDNKYDFMFLYFYHGVLYARCLVEQTQYDNGKVTRYIVSEAGPMHRDNFGNCSTESKSEAWGIINSIRRDGLQNMIRYHKSLALDTMDYLEKSGITQDTIQITQTPKPSLHRNTILGILLVILGLVWAILLCL